jgi:hypothetical protein
MSSSSSASRVLLAVLATSAIGQGAGGSVRGELASSLEDSLASRDSEGQQLAATRHHLSLKELDVVRNACRDQITQCAEDTACAQELGDLADGKEPISAQAKALVQCAKGAEPKLELELGAAYAPAKGGCVIL